MGIQVDVGGLYEQVYSFGHYQPDAYASYLEITTSSSSKPLQMSKEHMIFVHDRGFIPAGLLSVGDRLKGVGQLGDGQEEPVIVQHITNTKAVGIFAPFTASGKLIVDGVLVSSFVAFEQSSALRIGPATFSYQWIA